MTISPPVAWALDPAGDPDAGARAAVRLCSGLAMLFWACTVPARRVLVIRGDALLVALGAFVLLQVPSLLAATSPFESALALGERALIAGLAFVAAQVLTRAVHVEVLLACASASLLGWLGGHLLRGAPLPAPELAVVAAPLLFAQAACARRALLRTLATLAAGLCLASAFGGPLLTSLAALVVLAVIAGMATLGDDRVQPEDVRARVSARLLAPVLAAAAIAAACVAAAPAAPDGARGQPGHWRIAIEMVRDNQLVGTGLGDWRHQFPWYQRKRLADREVLPAVPAEAGNGLLQYAAETGLAGLLGALAVGLALLGTVRAPPGAPQDPRPHALAMCLAAAATAQLVVAFGPAGRCGPFGWSLLALCAGALVSPAREQRIGARHALLFFPVALWVMAGLAYTEYRLHTGAREQARARALRAAGQVGAALDAYREAVRLRALDAALAFELARYSLEAGELPLALGAAHHALDLSPSDPAAIALVAEAQRRTGDHRAAASAYEALQTVDPHAPAALEHLPETLLGAGRAQDALKASRATIARLGETAPRLANLAQAHWLLKDFAEAEHTLRDIVRRWPADPAGHLILAQFLRSRGAASGAEAAFRRVLELVPGHAAARTQLGAMLVSAGRRAEGLALLVEETAVRPASPDLRATLAFVAGPTPSAALSRLSSDTPALALHLARDALPTAGREGARGLRRALALLSARRGDPAGAQTELAALVAADPADVESWLALAEVHRARSEPDRAEQALESALRANPASNPVAHALGRHLAARNATPRALELLGRAAADPAAPVDALADFGMALARAGDPRARVVLERFLLTAPPHHARRAPAEAELAQLPPRR